MVTTVASLKRLCKAVGVFEDCASVLGYIADIGLYPSFHQLSEDKLSSDTVQSETQVHTDCALTLEPKKRRHTSMMSVTHQRNATDHHPRSICMYCHNGVSPHWFTLKKSVSHNQSSEFVECWVSKSLHAYVFLLRS